MALVAQLVVYGVIAGLFYALMGASWNLIYHTTRTFHFAQGFVFVAAGYTAALLFGYIGLIPAAIAAILVAVVLGIGIEVVLYRPLRARGATPFVIFISSLGMFILGENLIIVLFTAAYRQLEGFPITSIFLGPVTFTTLHVFTAIVCVICLALVSLFLRRTMPGRAIRAVACNPGMSDVVGIKRERIFQLVFGLGSAIAAIGAVLWSLDKGVLPTMAVGPLFTGFVVAIIGGIGSMPGAIVGGLLLGLAESLSLLMLPPEMTSIVTFLVLIIVLVIRPTGLFASEIQRLI